MRLSEYVFGYVRYRAPARLSSEIQNLCAECGVQPKSVSFEGEDILFSLYLAQNSRFLARVVLVGLEGVREMSRGGLPEGVKKLYRRAGVIIGIVVFCAILYLSQQVIFRVDVEGNMRLGDGEVRSLLADMGLVCGARKDSLNTRAIEQNVLIYSDDIAWISVNIRGSVAEVILRESESIPEEEGFEASNLVAARDGEIYLFEDTRGNILLEVGDYVREGELIVSGLYDSERGELRYTRSRGKILARTEREVSASIPYSYQKKVYTGRVYEEKYLIFFEKEIKFFESSGNWGASCDTIDTVEYLDIFSQGALPVGIRTVTHREYVMTHATRSPEEARELAMSTLSERMLEIPYTHLISKSYEETAGQTSYDVTLRIECIEDIAREIEIEIVD